MAKRIANKKMTKIIAATSMTIFSLFAMVMGTFAWFSTVKEVSNSGANINVLVKGKFLKISYHQYVGVPTAAAASFNKTAFASLEYNWTTHSFDTHSDFTFTMNQYDPMSKNKPVLVLIELTGDIVTSTQGSVYVKALTETAGFLGAKDDTKHQPVYKLDGTSPNLKIKSAVVDAQTVDYYPLSSVIKFRSQAFSDSQFTTRFKNSSTYDITIDDTAEPVDHNFTFVDVNADVSRFYQSSEIYDSGTNTTVKYIAIVVDYNDAAIEYIYSTYLGDPTLENSYDYILNFLCDWKWEIA